MPVETREGSVLVALVLQKGFTLLHTEFLQIPCRSGKVCVCIERRAIDTLARGNRITSLEAKTRGNHDLYLYYHSCRTITTSHRSVVTDLQGLCCAYFDACLRVVKGLFRGWSRASS